MESIWRKSKRSVDLLRSQVDQRFRPASMRDRRTYEDERYFPALGALFLRYLKRHGLPTVPDGDRAVGVVVVPWVRTPVPWYLIMLALGLARRGRRVVLIWDDTGFPEKDVAEQNRVIGRVLRHVGRSLPVVRVSDQARRAPSGPDVDAIEKLTEQNVTCSLRGATPEATDLPLVGAIRASLERSLPLVRNAVQTAAVECLVVPGGVYGTSGLFLLAAAEQGCRVATVDADRGVAQIGIGGVAAQNADVPRAFQELWSSSEETRSQAIATARAELTSRAEGKDRYGYQTVPAQAQGQAQAPGGSGGVLMPLNVVWDTAALGKHVHFADTVDWVTSTVAVILEMDAGPVIVRQHPSERRPLQRSRLDMAPILRERFGDDPRCRFVAAEDPVSSYDLLRSVDLVLPFTSNIGVEAAALGKAVLVSGASFYANLGFVWSAGSRDEYFSMLRRGLVGDLPPWPDQSDRAWLCYYLMAVRNRVWTDFTPQPDDFWGLFRRSPEELFAEPEVADILEAIDRDVPVSLLRHRRSCGSGK